MLRTPQMTAPPQFVPNPTANSLTVRATTSVLGIVEQVIAANDTPRPEIVIDVEILEVNRERAKQYGLDLSQYSLGASVSPERAPGGGGDVGAAGQGAEPGFFNLNTISRGVSIADSYTAVPAAVVNFLQRAAAAAGPGEAELTLNLGQEIPVPIVLDLEKESPPTSHQLNFNTGRDIPAAPGLTRRASRPKQCDGVA